MGSLMRSHLGDSNLTLPRPWSTALVVDGHNGTGRGMDSCLQRVGAEGSAAE
jgi:hypothetical protein